MARVSLLQLFWAGVLLTCSDVFAISVYQSNDSAASHPCLRACNANATAMTCYYLFTLDMYASMGIECHDCPFNLADCFRPGCIPAEGGKKALYLINRQLPGPTIEVCKGDRIIVDLANDLAAETTSLHWHGFHQRDTPFMDGVPYVTQCPLPPGSVFRYDFEADAAGTYLWHSHSNDQRGDGVFGALIVRSADPSPMAYDEDAHAMLIVDWTRTLGSATLAIDMYVAELNRPHTILVNGLGRYLPIVGNNGEQTRHMPTALFRVQRGKRYRFRVINAGVQDCPVEVAIDRHPVLLISVDGQDVEPVEVDSVRLLSGERADVVVTADREVGNYWIRIGGKDGSQSACDLTSAYQLAVLRYEGAPEADPAEQLADHGIARRYDWRLLNPYNTGTETVDAITIPTLDSLRPDDETSKPEADHKFYVAYNYLGSDVISNVTLRKAMWQLNRISLKFPRSPLLTQPELIEPEQICNADSLDRDCKAEFCTCTHVLNARLNSVVELVIVDEGDRPFNHPMHLHGYHFRVVSMLKANSTMTVDEFKRMDAEGRVERKLRNAPLKDTVMVPSGGYTVVRFKADNPGYWLFHCHYEMHSDIGMALVIKVGEHEDFVKPPRDFPTCGSNKMRMARERSKLIDALKVGGRV